MYPYCLLENNQAIFPLFGDQLQGNPYYFDFSSKNPHASNYNTNSFDTFQSQVFTELENSGSKWGIGIYLEERKNLLRNYPLMIDEGRYYHLGLDIVVPENYTLFAPLDSKVVECGREEEFGSYGGYIILQHEVQNTIFYSLYGHLETPHIREINQKISAGAPIGKTGSYGDSGHWFTHTHLQVITEEGRQKYGFFKGYIQADLVHEMPSYYPHPGFLFCNQCEG